MTQPIPGIHSVPSNRVCGRPKPTANCDKAKLSATYEGYQYSTQWFSQGRQMMNTRKHHEHFR